MSSAAALVFALWLCDGVGVARAAEPPVICPTPAARTAEAVSAARACVLAAERVKGSSDAALLDAHRRIGAWFAGGAETALGAVFFQKRALALTRASEGPVSLAAGDAALTLAQTWILSGRCRAHDPRATPLLESALSAYLAASDDPPTHRADRLRRVAHARADLLDFAGAASLLSDVGPSDPADWERLGDWRRLAGDPGGAAAAWERALSTALGRSRVRIEKNLRRVYFELGDADAVRRLDSGQ